MSVKHTLKTVYFKQEIYNLFLKITKNTLIEKKYQTLWQRYFVKTGIPERKNMKLHIQWMPKRYWKYLTEKF